MEILTDAAFTNVEITGDLIFRDRTFIDRDRNLNANTIRCDFLRCRNIEILDAVVGDPLNFLNLNAENRSIDRGIVAQETTTTNEALGENAACLGGSYNEALGNNAVTLGGEENQAAGASSMAAGRAAFAKHDHSWVWNTTGETPLESTAPKQCMFASDGGMFFKLPRATEVQTHMMPEGFACWCWDPTTQTVVLKTKQNNIMYKTQMDTMQNELSVSVTPDETTGTVQIRLNNPDLF